MVGVADAIAGALGLVDPGALAGAIDGPILSGTPTTDPDAANTINLVCVREDLVVPVGAVEVWSDKGSGGHWAGAGGGRQVRARLQGRRYTPLSRQLSHNFASTCCSCTGNGAWVVP